MHIRSLANTAGNMLCVFEGLTELLLIYEKIDDGSEIMRSERSPKLKSIRKQIRERVSFTSSTLISLTSQVVMWTIPVSMLNGYVCEAQCCR